MSVFVFYAHLRWTLLPHSTYDFFNFNTLPGGNITVNVMVSPSLNGYGNDRLLGFAVQVDSNAPQTQHFIPVAASGQLPAAWGTNDGFVANSIVTVTSQHSAPPGAHTLKVSADCYYTVPYSTELHLTLVDRSG